MYYTAIILPPPVYRTWLSRADLVAKLWALRNAYIVAGGRLYDLDEILDEINERS